MPLGEEFRPEAAIVNYFALGMLYIQLCSSLFAIKKSMKFIFSKAANVVVFLFKYYSILEKNHSHSSHCR